MEAYGFPMSLKWMTDFTRVWPETSLEWRVVLAAFWLKVRSFFSPYFTVSFLLPDIYSLCFILYGLALLPLSAAASLHK